MIFGVSWQLCLFIIALAVALACIGLGLYLTFTNKTLAGCFWAMVSKCPWLRRKSMEASE